MTFIKTEQLNTTGVNTFNFYKSDNVSNIYASAKNKRRGQHTGL